MSPAENKYLNSIINQFKKDNTTYHDDAMLYSLDLHPCLGKKEDTKNSWNTDFVKHVEEEQKEIIYEINGKQEINQYINGVNEKQDIKNYTNLNENHMKWTTCTQYNEKSALLECGRVEHYKERPSLTKKIIWSLIGFNVLCLSSILLYFTWSYCKE